MQRNNEIKTIGSLIDSSVFACGLSSDKMKNIVKQSTIFSFWSEIVGKKFEKISVPYRITAEVLYVAVKSPVVSQELSLNKKLIIMKINSYSMPLGISISDVVFNYKKFDEVSSVNMSHLPDDKIVWYNNLDLDKILIDKEFEKEICDVISKIGFLTDNQKNNLMRKILFLQKAKIAKTLDKSRINN